MEKREKVILVILGIAVLFGAYTYLGEGEGVKSVAEIVNKDELNKIVEEANKISERNPLSDMERYRLTAAEREWEATPFYDRTKDIGKKKKESGGPVIPEDVTITYNGFVIAGETMYAIINGMEYVEGEELEISGLFVQKIAKKKVTIGQINEEGEITGQLDIFLEEESF